MEKVYAPDSSTLIFTLYGTRVQKKHLVFSYGKKSPFLFLSDHKIPINAEPPAQIMRFRKYLSGKRITRAFSSWSDRILYLEFAESVFLSLDLKNGATLLFEDPPLPEEPAWPKSLDDISADNEKFRAVLTPSLRKTLPFLESADALALFVDLEEGGGDIFLYNGKNGDNVLSAWPLPEELREQKGIVAEERIFDSALLPASLYGNRILEEIWEKSRKTAAKPFSAEIHRLEKLRKKLDGEEVRLRTMYEKKKDALILQASLYLFSQGKKYPSVTIEKESGSVSIPLDPRYTVRENMSMMFHQAERGARGLQYLKKRRKEIDQEKEKAQSAMIRALASVKGISSKEIQQPTKEIKKDVLPKQVQAFRSSDGFLLLRGRDNKGNLIALKLASPHDYWLHTADGAGAHVIIRRDHAGQTVPEQTMREAGSLAALKSHSREEGKALIQYAQAKYIHPMKNTPSGMVRIDKLEGTFTVNFDINLEETLLKI